MSQSKDPMPNGKDCVIDPLEEDLRVPFGRTGIANKLLMGVDSIPSMRKNEYLNMFNARVGGVS